MEKRERTHTPFILRFDVSLGQFFCNLLAFQEEVCDRPAYLFGPMRKIPWSRP